MALAEMCCDVILTENDFKINHDIHSHGLRCLAFMHQETMILYYLEQPDTITKFTVLECRFVPKEVGDRVKVSLNFYRTDSKFCRV